MFLYLIMLSMEKLILSHFTLSSTLSLKILENNVY